MKPLEIAAVVKGVVPVVREFFDEKVAPLFLRLDGLEAAIKSIPAGPKGEDGVPGEKGEPGGIGPQGERGLQGEKGIDGAIGERGEKGDLGERGEQGPQGVPGDRGERGERGEPGADGVSVEPAEVQAILTAIVTEKGYATADEIMAAEAHGMDAFCTALIKGLESA